MKQKLLLLILLSSCWMITSSIQAQTTLHFTGGYTDIISYVSTANSANFTFSDGISYELSAYNGNANIYRAGNNAVVYHSYNSFTYHSFGRADGSEFKLSQLTFVDYGATWTFTGYRDGSPVSGAVETVTSVDYTTLTTVNFDSDFENIDEVRFSTSTGTAPGFIEIRSLTYEAAVTSAAPFVTTTAASDISASTAILSADVADDGSAAVIERGFVYSSSDNTPFIGETGVTQVSDGSGFGNFNENISGLSGSTTYYYQAYATNAEGTSYGGVESFATLTSQNPPSITSTSVKTIPYGQQYNYGVVASVEGNLETILSAPTLPAWLSFSTDGVGTAAQFGDIPSGVYLSGVAGDEEGNIYAIRHNGTEIFKIEPDGTTTSWKSGMISGSVYALHIANGYVYIPRYYNSTQSITRVPLNDPSATEEVFIARSGGVLSLTDKDGFIYATNYINSEILKINESTKAVEVVLTDADGIPTSGPFGLTFDNEDNLYIATWGNNTILKYDGTSVSTVLSNLPRNVSSIRVDASGSFYLSMSNGGVRKYSSDFSSFEVVSFSETDNIWSLSFTSSGSLVYAKYYTNEVYRLQTGAVLTGTPSKSDVGDHPVVLRATNDTGSTDQEFTITVTDETDPEITTLSPANNATDVALQPSLSITFDEEISLGTSGALTVNNGSTVLRTFDLSEIVDLNLIEVAEDKLSVSIPLDIALPVNTKISIGLSGGFVQDQAVNDFDGFTRDSNTWTFTTINKLDQNITFPEISTKTYGDDEFILGDEVTDQGLVVTYTAQDNDIISISGNKATILNAGTTQIRATQEGDEETFSAEPVTQTLIINKAAITIAADNKSKIFGGADPELTYEIAVGNLVGDDTFTGELIRETGENAGSYTIQQGTLNLSSNYDLTYKTADLTIEKAEAVITADAIQTFTYDGAEKEVTAELNHTEAELSYTPQQGYTNAGTYPVTVSSDETDNYLATSKEVSLVVDNAEITGVAFENETFTYNGEVHNLAVTGLPEGASVSYENNDQTAAGTYEVTATISQENFNDKVLTADLVINKAEAVITADAIQTFTYDGAEKEVTAELNHTEAELTYTPQQGYSDAGTYPVTISVEETDNYLATSKEVSLVVDNAEITGVAFENETFTYNSEVHNLAVIGLPEGASVSYENNDQTAAGTYEVTATISEENYNDKVLTADLVINKAEAVITADAIQTFTYDGTVKDIAATLNHSETELAYTPQRGYTNAGTYPVTISAEETDNYLPASKEVFLVIENAEIEGVNFEDETFTYDGTLKGISVIGLPEGATVKYENNGQINAGTYKVTATVSQENYNDKILTADLVINKTEAMITADATQTFTYDGTQKNVTAGLNHSEVEMTYSPQEGFTEPGTYEITVASAETENYLAASKAVTLVIEKAEITGVSFEGNTELFIYNGNEHSIFVTGLPEGATVTYANNGKTNAGTYTITAKVSKYGYEDLMLTATMLIEKASQSITFSELEDVDQLSNEYLQLEATSTSGLPVMYSYSYETENPAATVGPRGYVRILGGGQITITAAQAGNQNYEAAASVVRTLTINGSEAYLNTAVINGVTYSNPGVDIYYLIGCGNSENEVQIELEQNQGSTIDRDNMFTINTAVPGIYRETVIVTSGDGSLSTIYNIVIEKNFNFEDIVIQKFNNVLLVNNNPETNGGYKFVGYRWYKDGTVIGSGQYYSAGDNADDQLDADSSYYVVLETEDGEFLRTCTSAIQLRSSLNVALAPNPVSSGETMELLADFPKEELATMDLSIYNLNGRLIKQMKSNNKTTNISLPYNLEVGVYILKIETKNIRKSIRFIVK